MSLMSTTAGTEETTVVDATEGADLDIVSRYESIRDYSRVMQHYAHAGDWDRLLDLQETYVQAMASLATAEDGLLLPEASQDRKRALIHDIREAESDVRERLQTRMLELSEYMDDSRQRKRATEAYESGRTD